MPQRCNNCEYYLYESGSTLCLAAEPDAVITPDSSAENSCPHWREINWSDRHKRNQSLQGRVVQPSTP